LLPTWPWSLTTAPSPAYVDFELLGFESRFGSHDTHTQGPADFRVKLFHSEKEHQIPQCDNKLYCPFEKVRVALVPFQPRTCVLCVND
jgi:hypothetical protein